MRHLTEWLKRHWCFIDTSKAGESNSDWPDLVAWGQEICLASSVEAIQLWYSNINQRFNRFKFYKHIRCKHFKSIFELMEWN